MGLDTLTIGDMAFRHASAAAADLVITNNVDVVAPELTTVTIASSNANPAFAAEGDVVTLAFAADEALAAPTVLIQGAAADVSGSGTDWQATRTLTATDTEGAVTFAIDYEDLAGNAGTTVTGVTDASSVTFDRTAPMLAISDLPAAFTTLDPISVTFQFDEDVSGNLVDGYLVT